VNGGRRSPFVLRLRRTRWRRPADGGVCHEKSSGKVRRSHRVLSVLSGPGSDLSQRRV